MEFTDLTPDALDRLEAKLAGELETVRRIKALLREHFQPKGAAAGVPGAAVSPVPVKAAAPVAGMGTEPPAPLPQALPEGPPVPRKDLKTRVLETAAEMGKPFRMRDLEMRLRGYGERSTVRSALMRLVADGEVVILQKDMGRTGSLYQRKPAPAPAAGGMVEPAAEAAGNGLSPSGSPAEP